MIELLVVIAIIGILAALLLPVLSSARERGKSAQCVSNLGQIGIAIHSYADDNDDYFPPGFETLAGSGIGYSDWSLLIGPYLSKGQTTYGSTTINASRALTCPSGKIQGARLYYSGHTFLLPNLGLKTTSNLYRRTRVVRPSEVVLIMDGTQDPANYGGNAYATVDNVTQFLTAYTAGSPSEDNVISESDVQNADTGSNTDQKHIRYRHGGNVAANFLFVDGHVEAVGNGRLLLRNVHYDK